MNNEHSGRTLRDYLQILRRHKWVAIAMLVIVPAVSIALTARQEPLYQASADVLLSRQDLASSLTNTPEVQGQQPDPVRFADTQSELARTPTVVQRTLKQAGRPPATSTEFMDRSSVKPFSDADLLAFSVKDSTRAGAIRLATAYAHQFTLYRMELDTAVLKRAAAEVDRELARLTSTKQTSSGLYQSLQDKRQQLQTLETLQTSNVSLVRPAHGASQVQPRLKRNLIVALALGLLLGIALAFLREALDTRVRSSEEIGDLLGMDLLARLPAPPAELERDSRPVMLAEPSGVDAEAYRVLRSNLEFANLHRDAKSIMITSAFKGEGKSTTVTNLAVALALAGRRVVLVDLDLRRPSVAKLLRLESEPGLTNVALGHLPVEDALQDIDLDEAVGLRAGHGQLSVLTSGPIPPNPGEIVESTVVGETLWRLGESADVVLVDAPPLLEAGDALAMSAKVDGLLVITRLDRARRPSMAELRRVLLTCVCPVLGYVATAAEAQRVEGYGYYLPRAASAHESVR